MGKSCVDVLGKHVQLGVCEPFSFQTTLIMNLVYTCEGMGEKIDVVYILYVMVQHSLNSPLHDEWNPNSNNDDGKVKCFL